MNVFRLLGGGFLIDLAKSKDGELSLFFCLKQCVPISTI